MTPRRTVAEGPGVLQALVGALQNPSPLVVGAALATLNNLLLVRRSEHELHSGGVRVRLQSCWKRSASAAVTHFAAECGPHAVSESRA
jgi:hypothetical protein